MRFPFDVIVLDLETNGSLENRVVEIGAVRLTPDLTMGDHFTALVDGRPVTDEVVKIHHITNEMLVGRPKFAEAHGAFDEWCAKSEYYLLCAFGAYFDMPVLRAEYSRLGLKFPHRGEAIDIKTAAWLTLIKQGMPCKSLKLDRAMDLFGLAFEGVRHRALPDAWNEARLLKTVLGRM
jgi:DNA polymerase III epsilon subunit family exonuclease